MSRSTGGPRHDGDSAHEVTHHSAVTIRRPAAEVAAYVFDPTTMPHWSGVLYEIEPIADIEPRRGRRLRANLKLLGVCMTVEGELVEIDLDGRWAAVRIEPSGGGGVIEHRLSVEDVSVEDVPPGNAAPVGDAPPGNAAPVGDAPPRGTDGPPAASLLRFWNRVELPPWLSGTVSDDLIRRFLDHTATFALANIKDVLEHGEEGNVRRLQHLARQWVPAPTQLRAEQG